MMKLIGKEEDLNGKVVLITETKWFLFIPQIRKFVAQEQIAGDFWQWLELPHKKLVPTVLAWQLDAWKKD